MTKEELIQALDKLYAEYEKKIQPIYEEYRTTSNKLLKDWATENACFKVGDIIYNGTDRITIDTISCVRYKETPFIEYSGYVTDKKGNKGTKIAYVLEHQVKSVIRL